MFKLLVFLSTNYNMIFLGGFNVEIEETKMAEILMQKFGRTL